MSDKSTARKSIGPALDAQRVERTKEPDRSVSTGTLNDFFEDVYVNRKSLAAESVRTYRKNLRAFERWHGTPILLRDLSRELIRTWLESSDYTEASRVRRYALMASVFNLAIHLKTVVGSTPEDAPDKQPGPQEWHRSPNPSGRCPVCGCIASQARREHRATRREEGYSRRYIKRSRNGVNEIGPEWPEVECTAAGQIGVALRDFFETVYLRQRSLNPESLSGYRTNLRALDKWWGKPVMLVDATPELFRVWIQQAGFAPHYAQRSYGTLCTILNEATRLGYRSGTAAPTTLPNYSPNAKCGNSPFWRWFQEWASGQEISQWTVASYRRTILWLERCLDRDAELADFERDDLLTWFRDALLSYELAETTTREHVVKINAMKKAYVGEDPQFAEPEPAADSLATFVETYALDKGLAQRSKDQLAGTVKRFGLWLERMPTLSDLQRETVNRWIEFLQNDGSAPRTVLGHRGNLVVLWGYAAELGLTDPPFRVRKVKKPRPRPKAWTVAEVNRIRKACKREIRRLYQQGDPRSDKAPDVTRGDYLETLILAAYDSGLRKSDLFVLRRSDIRDDGRLFLNQEKTGDEHTVQLRPETLAKVLALPGECPLAWPAGDSSFYRLWDRVRKQAVIESGALHRIRKTAATFVAVEHPERVTQFLGHRTPSMRDHYVDRSLSEQPILPPSLDEKGGAA